MRKSVLLLLAAAAPLVIVRVEPFAPLQNFATTTTTLVDTRRRHTANAARSSLGLILLAPAYYTHEAPPPPLVSSAVATVAIEAPSFESSPPSQFRPSTNLFLAQHESSSSAAAAATVANNPPLSEATWLLLSDPRLSGGRIVDQASLLDPSSQSTIERRIAQAESRSGTEIVLVTLDTLPPYWSSSTKQFATSLFNEWRIGKQSRGNNGILIVTFLREKRIEVEIGDGLTPQYFIKPMLKRAVTPLFKNQDYSGGLIACVDEMSHWVEGSKLSRRVRGGLGGTDAIAAASLCLFLLVIPKALEEGKKAKLAKPKKGEPWKRSSRRRTGDDDSYYGSGGGGGRGGGGGGFSGDGGSSSGGGDGASW